MERGSLAERYDRLAKRNTELARLPSSRTPPTAVHVQTVRVLGRLLTMGQEFSTAKVPAPLRAMMRTLHKMEPMLIEELASVPPDAIREFLGQLRDELDAIIATPLEGEGSATDGLSSTADHAGPDLAAPA